MRLSDQFTAEERAILLLHKYPLDYVRKVVNGNISKSKKNSEIENCNYWNEVSIEIKNKINGK